MKIKKIKTLVNEEDRHQILWETEDIQRYDIYGNNIITKFIISSSVFVHHLNGEIIPETYLFPANENGYLIFSLELEGSLVEAFDHEKAIENVGFTIVESF
jgi:hypothetical protein